MTRRLTSIESLTNKRDTLLKQLWATYREISDIIMPDDFSEEDIRLWMEITRHSSVQQAISAAIDKAEAAQ